MSTLSVSLLGSFQATLDGRPIAGFESNKVRALLAYLAIESERPHSRDERRHNLSAVQHVPQVTADVLDA